MCDVLGGCYAYHRRDAAEGPCKGCLPCLATHGIVCSRCRARAGRAVTILPDLVVHLRASLTPGGAVADSGSGSIAHPKKFAPPAPVDLGAVDAADLLTCELVGWVRIACEELDLVGPVMPKMWHTGGRTDPAGLLPASTGEELGPVALWLLRHLDRLVELDCATTMITDREGLVRLVERTVRTHPLEQRPTRLGTPCPDCGRLSLTSYPPAQPGIPTTVVCTRQECGAHVLEGELPSLQEAALARAKTVEQSAIYRAVNGAIR